MKNVVLLFAFILSSAITNQVMAQDKSADSNTKLKSKTTGSRKGKDDNCYLDGNGGGKVDTTSVVSPVEALPGGKKAKEVGKSLINDTGIKPKFKFP
ncbi:MAG: hypothetical protein V4638_06575 [Bacteroidota bacterium]